MEKILSDWTPKEIEALKRATDRLKVAQPKTSPQSIKGVYYNEERDFYSVYVFAGGKKIYAGRVMELDEDRIDRLKAKARATYERIAKS